ncbi:MAG: pirin family protein [Bradymonadaceae bacterium]|nr:pirin family protein [Lujinxingiaceae bacterium]
MAHDLIKNIAPLGFPWQTQDPFLFCVHHLDLYPIANEQMGPAASLAGRSIGADFSGKDGWSMYHGDVVPGFPRHPHRGFETVTMARQGFIDHSDSLGATARFGDGDVQWMTAGNGVVHSEAFPLLDQEGPNTTELFQIWLNLPAASKRVDPYFSMFWRDEVPRTRFEDAQGRATEVTLVAGQLEGLRAPAPPPDSWAAKPASDVAIWTIKMAPGARWTLPAAAATSNRGLYFFRGASLQVAGQDVQSGHSIFVRPDAALELVNGEQESEILVLQGTPIGEPVAQHGPFVMNYPGEIRQAMLDYQTTGFGGWPWSAEALVHPREQGRFAIHADGREEQVGW